MRLSRLAGLFPAALVLLGAASLARAQQVDSVIALNGTGTEDVPDAGRTGTVGILIPGGTLSGAITVKSATGSSLIPHFALRAPDGTLTDQAALVTAGAKLKTTSTSVALSKVSFTQTGLYKMIVTGANGTNGKPTSGAFTITVKGKPGKGFSLKDTDPRNNIASVGTKVNHTVAVDNHSLLTATATPKKGSPFNITLKVVTPSGDEVDSSAFTTVNSKTSAVSIKAMPLPFFGNYTLRVGSTAGTGTFSIAVKVAPSKALSPSGVPDPDAVDTVVEPGGAGTLNGTGTTGATSIRWTQVSGPAATLTNSGSLTANITGPASRGTLVFQVVGTNTAGVSPPAMAIVEVDRLPVADPGPGVVLSVPAQVTLDGTGSSDLDAGDTLLYSWTQTGGPTATLDDPFAASPSFTPSGNGLYAFRLTVNDGTEDSVPETVLVSVGGSSPAADAGRPVIVRPQDTVYLSGLRSRSAAGGTPGTWSWAAVAGNSVSVTLAGSSGPVASFTAPKQPARLRFRLTVDGASAAADEVVVVVTNAIAVNGSPVAAAGASQTIAQGAPFTLSGSGTTDDGASLSYEWLQVAGTHAVLTADDAVSAPGTAPAVDEVLSFLLIVHDGKKYGAPDATTVDVGTRAKPLASAGTNQSGAGGTVLTLSSAASLPAPGQSLSSRTWTQVSGKDWYDVAVKDAGFVPTAASPSMTVPSNVASLTSTRQVLFSVTVTDPSGTSNVDYVTVTFSGLPKNSRPQVSGSSTAAYYRPGSAVSLTAVASDPDGDNLIYTWSQVSGNFVILTNPTTPVASLTAPTTSGNLVFRITVNDLTGEPNASNTFDVTFQVNQPPSLVVSSTPSAGPEGTPVTLSGTGTTDPENDTLAYAWTEIPPAVGSPVTLTNANTANASFTMPAFSGSITQRRRTFKLTVTDALGASFTTSANVTFTPNTAPVIGTLNSANGLKIYYSNSGGSVYQKSETLSAGPSTDVDGDVVTFSWRIKSGPLTSSSLLSATTGSSTTFSVAKPTASQNSTGGVYVIGVTASDGTLLSAESTASVVVSSSWNGDIYPLVVNSCNSTGCHGAAASGNLRMDQSASIARTNLLNGRVSANNYGASTFHQRLLSSASSRMPQGGPFWGLELSNMVRDWIEPEYNASPKPGINNGAENN